MKKEKEKQTQNLINKLHKARQKAKKRRNNQKPSKRLSVIPQSKGNKKPSAIKKNNRNNIFGL